ncbi:hypothetical protein [Nocardia macrotermitis]|uniref:Secreted protein n=1 Tax=Nocardia macrotermitis TaxID=2585198 RepID=A0A7K0D3H2_9NOCA|nr:hypothetical protein [Nocardia macrotermitis]MQY20283.1 hypothetical protein [Nocardia macrotermitis]
MKIVTVIVGAAAATLLGVVAAPVAAAPVTPVSNAGCLVHPIGPHKIGHGSTAPISFGFKVACYPRDPDPRAVTVKLWRKNVHTGQIYMHAERTDHSTKAMDEKIYYASCSDASVQWEFHTEAIATAVYDYSAGHDDGNSDPALLDC